MGAHKSSQWPLITFSYIHSLRLVNLQQNDKSYAIFYCQKPKIDSGDQDFTSRNHLFWSRLSPLKGFGPPIIKGTGLYKLILVWRGFIMTVHIVVWVITLMIRFCCSIYHEILLFFKEIRAFWGIIRAHKSPQWPLITFSCIHSLRWYNLQQNDMSYHMPYFIVRNQKLISVIENFTLRDHLFGPD